MSEIQNAFYTKLFNNFWYSVDAILEDVSVAVTMFDAYVLIWRQPPLRLKNAPNMGDPISLKENRTLPYK